MRKSILCFAFLFHLLIANCQLNYWQQQVNYTIDVTLNDKEHSIDAFEKIEYINNSPDTIRFIWFHIWPNAYKTDKTAFSDQLLMNGNTKFYFSDKSQRGYINKLDFKTNNIAAEIEEHPNFIDVIKVILPSPLPPGKSIVLTTPFHVQLPHNFSRGGHDGQSYQLTQWYPKPAVYDKNGWHAMPYLDQGEFYSEFGNFDVRITLPKNYVVAATGELQNDEEKRWLMEQSNISRKDTVPFTKIKKIDKKTLGRFPSSSAESKTIQFKQENIHDFAWFADKRFIIDHDTCKLTSGKIIDVFAFYNARQSPAWTNAVKFAKRAVQFYSAAVGEYPYNVVSVVEGPESFGGGMEYPTITVISPINEPQALDKVIAHELGHNWFYGILASNERDYPWMDEGINSYYENRYTQLYYKESHAQEKTFLETFVAEKLDQPIATASEKFSMLNYGLVAYYKTAEWMRWLEEQSGKEAFDQAMRSYFTQWKFKHPQPQDLKLSLEQSLGKNLDGSFELLYKKGTLQNQVRTGTKVTSILSRKFTSMILDNNFKNIITVGPAVGTNSYDNFMIGAFITNLKLPLNKFRFFLAPMYSTGAKSLTGIGKLDYAFYPNSLFRKVDVFVNGSTFSMNKFIDTSAKNHFLAFEKIVPGIRFTFKEKDPRSYSRHFIQWKTFFINEDGLRFSTDTIINGIDTSLIGRVSTAKQDRYLNQLSLVIENWRVLYPFRAELKIEQGEDFVRAGLTGNYFFNYPKEGGLSLRLFAGKFFYTGSKTILKQFETDRYHFNMTGPNGYEDYTYSDYFIGRNKFEGLPSQQIMMRDGGFKVRTDLLADEIGKTDDWLIAANFSTSIPSAMNPLTLLPVKIPLKLFFDIGTSAEAWRKDAEGDHFLYDAGLQVSALKNTINIYLPILYSSVYKDYIQSTLEKKKRVLKTISFSIDISNFSLKKIDRNIPF